MKRRYVKGDPADRIRARILQTESGCMEYQGHRNPQGYGRFAITARNVVLAHRFAYELEHGPIPYGMNVLHRCDNPACCNVDHLFLGSIADNNRDMWAKGRGRMANRSGQPKLTPDQVREIRRRYVPHVVTQKMLAREFGVSEPAISAIISRRNWATLAAVVVVCAGAVVQGVGYVVAERPVVVAVGDSGDVWAPMSVDASWGT